MKKKKALSLKLKSKKGMSLVELLCAIVIMAIVVACAASGLAVSYQSILLNGEHDKASAKAQEYCDVIMTAIQNTPSNEPGMSSDPTVLAKNKLFYSDVAEAKHTLKTEVQTYIHDVFGRDLAQVTESEAQSRTWDYDDVYFYIIEKGRHGDYIDYEVCVYVTYGGSADSTTGIVEKEGRVTYCKGTVTKPLLAE